MKLASCHIFEEALLLWHWYTVSFFTIEIYIYKNTHAHIYIIIYIYICFYNDPSLATHLGPHLLQAFLQFCIDFQLFPQIIDFNSLLLGAFFRVGNPLVFPQGFPETLPQGWVKGWKPNQQALTGSDYTYMTWRWPSCCRDMCFQWRIDDGIPREGSVFVSEKECHICTHPNTYLANG